jgi:hypothetical protein
MKNTYYTTLPRFIARKLDSESLTGKTITISGLEYHEFNKSGKSPNIKRTLKSIVTGEEIIIC